jgi:hypothetical protein
VSAPRWFRLALLTAFGAAFCAYANSFANGFTIYDFPLFLNNERIRHLSNIPSFFADAHWGGTAEWGFYRPLATVTHALDYFFFGRSGAPMRMVNIALHGINAMLVMRLALALGCDAVAATISGLVFALHPVQTDAIDQIATRSDLLAACFTFLALLVYVRTRRAAAASLLYLCGLFSKEMAITLPAVIVLYDLLYDRPARAREWLSRLGPFALAAAAYLGVRLLVIPGGSVHYFGGASRFVIALTMAKVFAIYLRLYVAPWPLSITYGPHVIPNAHGLGDLDVLVALALHAALCGLAFGLRKRDRRLAFAILFFYITLAPVSHLVTSTPTIAGERFLYPGTFGFALILGLVGARALERVRPLARPALILGGGLYLGLTWLRNVEWRTELTIWRAAAETYPQCIQAAYSYGTMLAAEGRLRQAADPGGLQLRDHAGRGGPAAPGRRAIWSRDAPGPRFDPHRVRPRAG